jgi:hypothetical protein
LLHDLFKEFLVKIRIKKAIPESADGRVIGKRTCCRETAKADKGDPVVERFFQSRIALSVPSL